MAQEPSKTDIGNVASAQKVALDLFHSGDYRASNEILLRLIAATGPNAFRSFGVGRNYRHLNEPEAARLRLTKARAMRNPFIWVHIELALLEQQSGNGAAARTLIGAFFDAMAEPSPPLTVAQKRLLLEACHGQFAHDPWTALALYRRIDALGIEDATSAMRLLEDLLNSGQTAEADARLAKFRAKYPLDAAAQFVLGRILHLRGEAEAAGHAIRRWRASLSWATACAVATMPVMQR